MQYYILCDVNVKLLFIPLIFAFHMRLPIGVYFDALGMQRRMYYGDREDDDMDFALQLCSANVNIISTAISRERWVRRTFV